MYQRKRMILTVFIFSFCVLLTANAFAVSEGQQNPGQQNQGIEPTPLPEGVDSSDPALPAWMHPTAPVSPVTKGEQGELKIVRHVQNVTLPVVVTDDRQRRLTDLQTNNFNVYEKGALQKIIKCTREDVPVSIGILVDNSGSMREKRQKVSAAVLNLIKASNPGDEVFIVNFNDEPFLDQDFTSDLHLMHEAMDRLDSRGGTALYDAVIASYDHLAKAAKREKKILLVVTDGEDNESHDSLEQAIRTVQDQNGPMIYTIGILGTEGKQHRAKRALEALSFQTGGVAFFPKNLDEVETISQQVAHDIRNQYTIVYSPSDPPKPGEFRPVQVEAHASGYRDLKVRTKNGYFAGEQRGSGNK